MKNSHRRGLLRIVLLTIALALVAAACGDKTEVGSGLETKGGAKGGAIRDEQTTTTAPPQTTTTPPTTAAPKPTTTAKPTTTSKPPEAAVTISIQDDEQGLPFEPASVRVAMNSLVEWKNVGTKPRQIKAQDGAFQSPVIPPGGVWRWKATKGGTHNYEDQTRPYAVSAKITVG